MRKPRNLRLLAVLLALAVLAPVPPHAASAAGDTTFVVDLNNTSADVPNIFSNMAFFNYPHTWTNRKIEAQAPLRVRTNYPWVREAYLQYATGGCYKPFPGCLTHRDLLADGANPAAGYDFDPIHRAARNVLRQGLKPYIDLGGVPVNFADPPWVDLYFRVNLRPPADYNQYHDYIYALVQSLVSEFGLAEVRTWRWSVINEYENRASFEAPDRNWLSTAAAYFKLYDYTVGALEEALGASFVNVGAHCMCVIDGLWDERALLNHAVQGPNLYNGGPNTQLDFIAVSFYEITVGDPGTLAAIDATITHMRDRANQLGLGNLPIGIDEGGILWGQDNKRLMYSETGQQWQSSWTASLFKRMLDLDVAWFGSLSMSSKALIGGVPPAHVNVINLASRLAGAKRLPILRSGTPANGADEVQSVAAYNAATKTAYVLVFNHNPSTSAGTAEPTSLQLQGIRPATGTTVNVKRWTVDENHGNYWPTWQWIAAGCGVPDSAYKFSKHSAEVPLNLSAAYKPCWKNYHSLYKSASALQVLSTNDLSTSGNQVSLSTTLAHHGVTMFEVTNAEPAP